MTEEVQNNLSYQTQVVLPKTAELMVDAHKDVIGSNLRSKLLANEWGAIEVRGIDGLPPMNFYSTDKNRLVDNQFIDKVTSNTRKISSLFGYNSEKLDFLNIIVDSTNVPYEKAIAQINYREKSLLIKQQKSLGLNHELTHWIMSNQVDPAATPELLWEGIATWAAWQTMSEAERNKSPFENYNKICQEVWRNYFSFDDLRLDTDYHNVPVMHLGGVLFDVLLDRFEGDVKKIGSALKSADQFQNISGWIRSLGFSPEELEVEWQNRILKTNGVTDS